MQVYLRVAKLFQNQDDLLQEFSQFLPDASGSSHIGVSQAIPMRDNSSSSYMPPSKKQSRESISCTMRLIDLLFDKSQYENKAELPAFLSTCIIFNIGVGDGGRWLDRSPFNFLGKFFTKEFEFLKKVVTVLPPSKYFAFWREFPKYRK